MAKLDDVDGDHAAADHAAADSAADGPNTAWRAFRPLIRLIASLKLAVVLILVLGAVLSVAKVLEATHGLAYADWYIYKSSWLLVLFALLAAYIVAAAAIRFPWKRHHAGLLVTHAGLLILVSGSMVSRFAGVEGQILLAEGETTDKLTLPERSQISAVWDGRAHEAPYEFSFDGGPVDWNSDRTLDVGEVDGISLSILRFLRRAEPKSEWIAAAEGGCPLVKFRLNGPGGKRVAEHFLADHGFGEALLVGPIRIQLQRAHHPSMLADFQIADPPAAEGDGLLTAYYQDAVAHIPVSNNIGKKTALGNTGALLEIAEYLPNARPDSLGRFATKGTEPKNPMLELRVQLPDFEQPLRQVAFAKDDLLNLDGVYARRCPVTFRYRHPAVKPQTAVEFLQADQGQLYARIVNDGRQTVCGAVSPGKTLPLANGFELIVTDYLPHADNKLSFEPAAAEPANSAQPAALVEVRVGDAARQVWLWRNDLHYGLQKVSLPEGVLILRYGCGEVPLGFALKLESFRRDSPGADKLRASKVRVIDEELAWEESREISADEPLTHRRYTFHQSGFHQTEQGREASVLSVGYDPGRPVKIFGGLMICTGIAVMFYTRAYYFKRHRSENRAAMDVCPDAIAANPVDSSVPAPLRRAA